MALRYEYISTSLEQVDLWLSNAEKGTVTYLADDAPGAALGGAAGARAEKARRAALLPKAEDKQVRRHPRAQLAG